MTDASQRANALRATFMGVTTILFDDGQSSVLIDGFFTRPSYRSCTLSKISPDPQIVARCLEKAGIERNLQAVLVAHSHFDHLLDSPTVCKQTGATLVGSQSTEMFGNGHDMKDDQIKVVKDGDTLEFGAIRVTFFEGIHSPGDIAPGEIEAPLSTPCSYKAMRSSKCYSYLIEHKSLSEPVFVHPSANYVPDKFHNIKTSLMFLGVGTVGKLDNEFRNEYWKQIVEAMAPRKVVPIHWDNLWLSLDQPLTPLPEFADNWSVTHQWLKESCEANNIELHVPKAFEVIELQ